MPAKKTTTSAAGATRGRKKVEKIKVADLNVKNKPSLVSDMKTIKKSSAVAEKIKSAKTAPVAKPVGKKKLGMYKKIAGSFVFLTVVLLAAIFYFTFIKLIITVVPETKTLIDHFAFNVLDPSSAEAANFSGDYFTGLVEETEINQEKKYEAGGVEVLGEEVIGKVIIKNNHTSSQPLVATTRLLSLDNKLFRIKNTVNVPAGGQVEVEVYADEPSEEMAIAPTKFTIPGLWAGLQDKIFAESSVAFSYQKQTKNYILQADIDAAVKDIKESLTQKIANSFLENYKGYDKVLFTMDENSISTEVSGKVGEEKKDFSVNMKAKVVIIAFNSAEIKAKAEDKLRLVMPADQKLLSLDDKSSVYEIQDFSVNRKTATVRFSFSGTTTLTKGQEIIDRHKIVGLTEEQLEAYLRSFDGISSFEIKFSPAFIKKVPNLVDRIEVKIK